MKRQSGLLSAKREQIRASARTELRLIGRALRNSDGIRLFLTSLMSKATYIGKR